MARIALAQVRARSKELGEAHIRTMEEVADRALQRGVVIGIKLFMQMPHVMLERSKQEWQQLVESSRSGK